MSSRWHREHPDYQETGWEPPDWRAHADEIRKRLKEEPTEDDRIRQLLGPESYAIYREWMDK